MSRYTETGFVIRCRTKRSAAGNMMTSFRFSEDGPVYFIAMHAQVANHAILGNGVRVTVDGDLIDNSRGAVFVRSLTFAGSVLKSATGAPVACSTCSGLGFHRTETGEIAVPCESCGTYPKEYWL